MHMVMLSSPLSVRLPSMLFVQSFQKLFNLFWLRSQSRTSSMTYRPALFHLYCPHLSSLIISSSLAQLQSPWTPGFSSYTPGAPTSESLHWKPPCHAHFKMCAYLPHLLPLSPSLWSYPDHSKIATQLPPVLSASLPWFSSVELITI